MQTAKKIQPTPLKSQRTTHLENLLLNRDDFNNKSAQQLDSRIEAESRMEMIFRNIKCGC